MVSGYPLGLVERKTAKKTRLCFLFPGFPRFGDKPHPCLKPTPLLPEAFLFSIDRTKMTHAMRQAWGGGGGLWGVDQGAFREGTLLS